MYRREGLSKAEARVRSKAINGGKIAVNCRLTKLQASLAHRRVATNKKRRLYDGNSLTFYCEYKLNFIVC